MYKYQCSKQDCGCSWTLHEGNLNGFVLTCPVCGKGRGLFVSQSRREMDKLKNDGTEEIIISVNSSSAKTVEELNIRIEEFLTKHSLILVEKDIESKGNEVVCTLKYKMKN
jgi:hypothetical protein